MKTRNIFPDPFQSSDTQTLCDPRYQEIAMFSRDRPRVSGRNFHPQIKENKQMHE
jgi:hypothetical protein